MKTFRVFLKHAGLLLAFAGIALLAGVIPRLFPHEWSVNFWAVLQNLDPLAVLLVVILMGFLEALFPVCHYVPGTFIYVAIVVGKIGALSTLPMAFGATAGVLIGSVASYLMGRWFLALRILNPYRSLIARAVAFLERHAIIVQFLASLHPNQVGLLYIAYGTKAKVPFLSMVVTTGFSFLVIYIYTMSLSGLADRISFEAGWAQFGISAVLLVAAIVVGVRGVLRNR